MSGGSANKALGIYSIAAGGGQNQTSAGYATVSGGQSNHAAQGHATVGGGQANTAGNPHATVGGGQSNNATTEWSTIGGGSGNNATGGAATIAGGKTNLASGGEAVIGGGLGNTATSQRATVGGGGGNHATGSHSTVPGGNGNEANGVTSFAAGNNAIANHNGVFIWADYDGWLNRPDFASAADDEFAARASGGFRFVSAFDSGDGAITAGVKVAAGGTSWTSISDRRLKENYAEVDTERALAALVEMPVRSWNVRAQRDDLRHVGPVAQDFNESFRFLFGEVESETHINNMDAVGVTMSAIQGMYAEMEELRDENAALRGRLGELEAVVRGWLDSSGSREP